MGHAAEAFEFHAFQDQGAVRFAGGEDARVGELEGALTRARVDGQGLRERDRRLQLELGVAAAPFAVAVGAVGVQVGAGPVVQALLRVAVIGQSRQLFGRLWQLVLEDAEFL